MISESIKIGPTDKRCKHWAKIVRSGGVLPMPVDATGANSLAAPYAKDGDEELLEGDFLFEGEANHHTRQQGWSYWLGYIGDDGVFRRVSYSSARKAVMKANGLPVQYLLGTGDVAGLVRMAHALRQRIGIDPVKVESE